MQATASAQLDIDPIEPHAAVTAILDGYRLALQTLYNLINLPARSVHATTFMMRVSALRWNGAPEGAVGILFLLD